MLQGKHITFSYSDSAKGKIDVLKDVSFEIREHDFIGLIGTSGSGKTTLIKHLNGLLKAESGEIFFNGENIYSKKYPISKLRKEVGLVFQYPEQQLFGRTILKDVMYGPLNLGMSEEEAEKSAVESLELVGISKEYYHLSPMELSGGQKRCVAIAGVLAMQPEILVLDEPAAGLDPETPPTTYDEVLEDAKKIVESGAAPVGYSQAIYGWFFEQQLAGLGVTYGNNDNGRKEAVTAVDFDSNGGGLKVFDMWKKLYDSGYFEDYGTTTADTQTAFFSGQVGMIIESTAILKNAVDSSPFEVGTGYLPRIEQNDEGGVIIGGGSLWLTDTGNEANEDAAWKFIEYITTPDVQAKWSMGTGYFAINEKAYETEDMKAYLKENPNFETAINQLKDSPVNCNTAGVLSGVQTEARLTFNEIMPQVYDGKLTTQDAVDQLAASVNKAIENYNESIK